MKTASGATAVQIVHSSRRGSRDIEHIGSAHTEVDVELLKAAAKQRLVAGQDPLDFGDGRPEGAALPIMSTRAQHLWDLLTRAYTVLGFDRATGGDKVFRDLVLARLIEPTSKADSVRVIDEVGMPAPAYRTIKRRIPRGPEADLGEHPKRVQLARGLDQPAQHQLLEHLITVTGGIEPQLLKAG